MQRPIFFENEIVQPKNLDFFADSFEKVVAQNFATWTRNEPGIGAGLQLTAVSGSNSYTVAGGFGYLGGGERVELFSGTNFPIGFTGTKTIYAKKVEVNYNPDPSENPAGPSNVVTNIDPNDDSLHPVEEYNLLEPTETSGVGFIKLGSITTEFQSPTLLNITSSGSDHLRIAGFIDLNTNTIDGALIETGTISTTKLANPLTVDLFLNTGVSFFPIASTTSQLGTAAVPFANIYAMTGTFHQINGSSPILIDNLTQLTNTSLEAQSGSVQIDLNNNGTRFGGIIKVTGITPGATGSLDLNTPDGDINIQPATGTVNLLNDTNIGSVTTPKNLILWGSGTIKSGLSTEGEVDLSKSNVTISENHFKTNNLVPNSHFTMGTHNGSGVGGWVNYMRLRDFQQYGTFSPFEERYQNNLLADIWETSGTITTFLGTRNPSTGTTVLNEIQRMQSRNAGVGDTHASKTGTFFMTFGGESTDQMKHNINDADLTSELNSLTTIDNVNVSGLDWQLGGQTDPFGLGPAQRNITFGGLQAGLNLSQMVITGVSADWATTVGTPGLSTPGMFTLQNGRAAVTPIQVLTDPSVFTEDTGPGVETFLRISGDSLTDLNKGRISVPLYGGRPNTTYNVSAYYKIMQSGSSLDIKAGIYNTAHPTGVGSGMVSFDIQRDAGTTSWLRTSQELTTPAPNTVSDNFNLIIDIASTGVNPTFPILSLTAVQVTEGRSLYGYAQDIPTVLSLIEPSGLGEQAYAHTIVRADNSPDIFQIFKNTNQAGIPGQTNPGNAGNAGQTWVNGHWDVGEHLQIISGTIYSPGGIVDMKTRGTLWPPFSTNINAIGLTTHFYHNLTIDGVIVADTMHYHSVDGWKPVDVDYRGYLAPGVHKVTYEVWNNGATGGAQHFQLSGTTPAALGDVWSGPILPSMPRLYIQFDGN